jgi:hypothetical protein
MKNILSIFTFLFFISTSIIAQTPDKIVTFYDNYDIQQFKGVEWHKKFTKISDISKYSKAVLVVELGCATYGCCAWDYTFRGFFGLPQPGTDSVFEKNVISGTDTTKEFRYYQKSTNYEVGRLITPYSSYMRMSTNGFNPKWRHPYVYDVTDFLPIMKDSFGFVALTGGWDDQGKFGFNMNVNEFGNPQTGSNANANINGNNNPNQESINFSPSKTGPKMNLTFSDSTGKPVNEVNVSANDDCPLKKQAKYNPSLDWKGRTKQICEQVRRRGLDPQDFGCLKETDEVSENYSWRGHAKMVCSRLDSTPDPALPQTCGCPPVNWGGWNSDYSLDEQRPRLK